MKNTGRVSVVALMIMVTVLAFGSVGQVAADAPRSEETNKDIVHRWMDEVLNQGNITVVDQIISPEFVGHDPLDTGSVYGQAGARALVSSMRAMLTGFHVTEQALVAEGEMVSCMTISRGRFTEPWGGLLPNGAEIQYVGHTLFHIQDGQIVEAWFVYDTLGLMQQLTAPPAEPWLYP